MNKRVLDGVGVWKSDKIARIQPERIRAEYANWIPLALANGSFEADTRRIWSTVYSYNRPDICFDNVEEIKREFCRVGLLFLWQDEGSGKIWGYFTGIEKPGRLPAKSRLDRKHEPIGPIPPADALRSYRELTRSKALDADVVSQWLANGCLGFGFGSGIGIGLGVGKTSSQKAASTSTTSEAVTGFRRHKVAPGDSRFQPFLAFAFESFAAKHGRKPLWQGKDLNGLKNLLKNHSAESVSLERLQANWQNFLDSTEPFTVKQGDSLCYFCSNVDKFSDGPILAALGRGGTNGKPTATDLAIRNARRSDSTSQLIKQWLFRFGIEHKEDVAPRLPLWLETFGGMDPAILESLFQRALKTCRFFPKISEILEHVDHTKETALAGMAKGAGPASHGLES